MTELTHDTLLTHAGAGMHMVQCYQDPQYLASHVAHYVASGLTAGEGAIIVAIPEHWALFAEQLTALGVELDVVQQSGQLTLLDAQATLDSLLVDGVPNSALFERNIGGAINQSERRFPVTRAYGEMVNLLWQQGRQDAAMQLEDLWNNLSARRPFALLCAYRVDDLDPRAYGGPMECICGAHTHLLPGQRHATLSEAMAEATADVFGPTIAARIDALAHRYQPPTAMPMAQAKLFYLAENVPIATDRLLRQIRAA